MARNELSSLVAILKIVDRSLMRQAKIEQDFLRFLVQQYRANTSRKKRTTAKRSARRSTRKPKSRAKKKPRNRVQGTQASTRSSTRRK